MEFAYFSSMNTALQKTLALLFVSLFWLTAHTQQYDNGFRVSVLDLKFVLNNVHSNYDSLMFTYKDQAASPHYFWDTIRTPSTSTLMGGEITAASMSINRKIYVDGATIGVYGGHQQVLLSVFTGGGYQFNFAENFKVIPHVLVGWSSLDYYHGAYTPSDGNDYVINGVTLDGESTLKVHNSTWWAAPRLSFAYQIGNYMDISLSAGYRIPFRTREKIEFADGYKQYAYIPLDQSVHYHGANLNNHIYSLAGMMFSIGFAFYLD